MAVDKNQTNGKNKPKELYLKIPYHILNIPGLGLCEKVLLAHIYSFGEKFEALMNLKSSSATEKDPIHLCRKKSSRTAGKPSSRLCRQPQRYKTT